MLGFLPISKLHEPSNVCKVFRCVVSVITTTWTHRHFYASFTTEEQLAHERLLSRVNESDTAAQDEVLARRGPISLTRQSLKTLDPGVWLNDKVINYYLQTWLDISDTSMWIEIKAIKKRQGFFNSYFLQQLHDKENIDLTLRNKYNYRAVKNWGKRHSPWFNIFKLRRLFIPWNIANYHWVLIVVDFEEKKIQYYDATGSTDWFKLSGVYRCLKDEYRKIYL